MIHGNLELHNVEDILPTPDGKGTQLSRVPNELRISLNEMAKICALGAAGSEIRLNLEGPEASIVLASPESNTWNPAAMAQVYQGSFMVSSHVVGREPTAIKVAPPGNLDVLKTISQERSLPFDPTLTRVILPIWPPTILVGVEGETSVPRAGQVPRERLLAYGSSITHGAFAVRPTGTYPSRLCQMLGIDHVNLGFGGGAHCEEELADYIARRPDWSMATLEIGINMVGNSTIDTEEFRRRARYFIGKIAGENPEKWIFCIDMFTAFGDLSSVPSRFKEFRRTVRDEARRPDLPRLVHIDGRRLLRNPTGLSLDLVHPSPEGMEEIAQRLSRLIRKRTRSGDSRIRR